MIDNIKRMFFTFKDLNGGAEENETSFGNKIYNNGAKSQLLMRNSIFQDSVQILYLSLVEEEEQLDPLDGNLVQKVENLRLQRRLLRQVVGKLDNNIFLMEQKSVQDKLTLEESDYED